VQNASVDRTAVTVGETVTVTATVANEGDADGSETVNLSVDGRVVDERDVTLSAGETTPLTLQARLDAPGERTLRVGRWSRTVDVAPGTPNVSVADVRVGRSTVQTGEQATVVATVTNDGSAAGQYTAKLHVFGEVVKQETVTVPPGESRTVRFSQRFDSPGDYDVEVAGQRRQVRVTGEATSAVITMETPDGANRAVSMGFIAIGGFALAAAAIFASRRL